MRDNGNVIASDVGLLVPCAVRFPVAHISTGHLSDNSVFDVRDQRRVLDVQIRDGLVSRSAHIFYVTLAVCCMILRRQVFRRVPARHILTLKRRERRSVKHVFRVSIYGDDALGIAVELHFSGRIFLSSRAIDGDIMTDQVSLRRLCHVRADSGAVICQRHYSTPGTSSSWSADSPAATSSSRSAIMA